MEEKTIYLLKLMLIVVILLTRSCNRTQQNTSTLITFLFPSLATDISDSKPSLRCNSTLIHVQCKKLTVIHFRWKAAIRSGCYRGSSELPLPRAVSSNWAEDLEEISDQTQLWLVPAVTFDSGLNNLLRLDVSEPHRQLTFDPDLIKAFLSITVLHRSLKIIAGKKELSDNDSMFTSV